MYEIYLFKVSKNNKEKQNDIRKDIITCCVVNNFNNVVNTTHLIQNPRVSSALRIPGVSASATSGFVLFLRITDLLLLQPPMKTCDFNTHDTFDSHLFI